MNLPLPKYSLRELATECFRELLSEKHLYQSTRFDAQKKAELEKEIRDGAESRHTIPGRIERLKDEILRTWNPVPDAPTSTSTNTIMSFVAPRIQTYCHKCGDRMAFVCRETSRTEHECASAQTFMLVYECQGACHGTKVCFLVKRDGEKLTLVGRDRMETVEIPKTIPKTHAQYFRDASFAFNSGQVLPAIFLLRTFIEQFWRANPAVATVIKTKEKPTGEELGAAYKTTLLDGFKSMYPVLTGEYDRLSEAMHTANADAEIFNSCREQIEAHFEALAALHKAAKIPR